MFTSRSPLLITLSVWKALLLREALTRFFARRASWFWLLLEPLAHIAILSFIFAVIRQRTVGNMETVLWIVLGMIGFFTFRRTAQQSGGAIDSNRALLSYRQVKAVDTVFARATLEGFTMILVASIALFVIALMGIAILPSNPLAVLFAVSGLWTFGVGLGLIVSALAALAPEARDILQMFMLPLYFVSGVIIPLSVVPLPYRSWLMYNPIAHGLEALRHAFSVYYHVVPETSMLYLWLMALCSLVLGLLLHRRFATRIVAQ